MAEIFRSTAPAVQQSGVFQERTTDAFLRFESAVFKRRLVKPLRWVLFQARSQSSKAHRDIALFGIRRIPGLLGPWVHPHRRLQPWRWTINPNFTWRRGLSWG